MLLKPFAFIGRPRAIDVVAGALLGCLFGILIASAPSVEANAPDWHTAIDANGNWAVRR